MLTDSVQPIRRSAFSSRDPERTTEFFRQAYVGNRTSFRQVAPQGGFVAQTAGVATMRADRLRGALGMSITADPLGYVLFGQLESGRWTLRAKNQERRLGPDDCVLYPSDAGFELDAQNFDFRVVSLPLNRVSALAASHSGIDPADLRFDAMAPVSPVMARVFASTLALIHRELTGPDSAAANPLIAEALTQTAAAAVLTTFANTAMGTDHLAGAGKVAPAALRRAVAHIDAHLAEPIALADIAAAAGTTGRAVQAAFQRHYGVTPMAYLRRARLGAAHRDLQAADPVSGDTVIAIAMRWGFSHAARFTSAYQEQYGVLPSHTLRT